MKFSLLHTVFLVVALVALPGPSQAQTRGQIPAPSKEMQGYLDAMNAKLDGIIIPEMKCDKASLSDAVEQLRKAAHDNDKVADENAKGINIFVKLAQAAMPTAPIALDLKTVSLRDALEAVAKQTGLTLKVEPYAVSLITKR